MRPKGQITDRQKELLSLINDHITDHGYAPTLAFLRQTLKLKSNQTVLDILEKLEFHGLINRDIGKSRSIRITEKGINMLYNITSYDYQMLKEESMILHDGDSSQYYTNSVSKLAVFQDKKIRREFYSKEWWFSIVDIIEALTGTDRPRKYWNDLKTKLTDEGYIEVSEKIGQLKMQASDGKYYATDCANTETLFRIIQSIPSPKAETFKRWLAKVGYERVQEIEDPELASKRARKIYKAKGYSEAWIEKRMRGIQIREELTNEWKNRGITENRDFAILTAEISKATFDMTPSEYKDFKGLERENLRDHMNDLELIFNMLGEASTTEIAKSKDAQGIDENKTAAKQGGTISGDARKALESKTGKRVSTNQNYLEKPQDKKLR